MPTQVAAIARVSPELIRKLSRLVVIPKAERNRYELSNTLPPLYRYLWRSSCRSYVFREIEMPHGFGLEGDETGFNFYE